MRLNIPTEYKNILQVLILFIIGIMCDALVIAIISNSYIPEIGWSEPHYTNIELWYRNFFNQYLYDYRSFISFITNCIYLLLIKIFLFSKIVISIENSKEKTKISEIIRDIHNNKNIILLCFIVFCLLSFLFVNFCTDISLYNDLQNINDTNNLLKNNKTKIHIELIKYVLITNPFFIILSLLSLFITILNMFPRLEYILIFVFIPLMILLILFYLYAALKLLIRSLYFVIKNIIKIYKQ